jgi:hypothetical protein
VPIKREIGKGGKTTAPIKGRHGRPGESQIGGGMFKKDYWRMTEEELTKLAEKYHVPTMTWTKDPDENLDADMYFDRDRVIQALTARDTALRAGRAMVTSLIALLVAVAAFLFTIFKAILSL